MWVQPFIELRGGIEVVSSSAKPRGHYPAALYSRPGSCGIASTRSFGRGDRYAFLARALNRKKAVGTAVHLASLPRQREGLDLSLVKDDVKGVSAYGNPHYLQYMVEQSSKGAGAVGKRS